MICLPPIESAWDDSPQANKKGVGWLDTTQQS